MSEGAPATSGLSLLKNPLLWTVLAALAAAWPLATLILGDPFAPPTPRFVLVPAGEDPTSGPVFTVPPFTHVDHRGEPFGSAALEGTPWVASFFFTSCPSICPRITEALVKLQARLDEAESPLRMVTFTVDPETDLPEVLARHAAEVGAGERWTFVTGDPEALAQTIVDGFKQPMGAPEGEDDADTALDIAHGVRLVLLDGAHGVRGLYDIDDAGLDALLRDAALLGKDPASR